MIAIWAQLLLLCTSAANAPQPAHGEPRPQDAAAPRPAERLPVRFVLRTRGHPERRSETVTYIREFLTHVRKNYPEYSVAAYVPFLGEPSDDFILFVDCADLPTFVRIDDREDMRLEFLIGGDSELFGRAGQHRMLLVRGTSLADRSSGAQRLVLRTVGRVRARDARTARQRLADLSHHVNRLQPSVAARAFVPSAGELGTIHWYREFNGLPTWESIQSELEQDERYRQLLDRFLETMVEGTLRDDWLLRLP